MESGTICDSVDMRPSDQAIIVNWFNVPEEQQIQSEFNATQHNGGSCKGSLIDANGVRDINVCSNIINTDDTDNISVTKDTIKNGTTGENVTVDESNTPTIYIAGYDDQIFELMTDMQKQAQGHELLVYFHLCIDNKLYNLGCLYTDKEILQNNILKYTHYICLCGTNKSNATWCFDNVGIILPNNFKSKVLVKQQIDASSDSDKYVLLNSENFINSNDASKTFSDFYESILSKENDTILKDIYIDILRSKGIDINNLPDNQILQIENIDTSTNNISEILTNLNLHKSTTISPTESKYKQQNVVHLIDIPTGSIHSLPPAKDKSNFTYVTNISSTNYDINVSNLDKDAICKIGDQEKITEPIISKNFFYNTPIVNDTKFMFQLFTKPIKEQDGFNLNSKVNIVKTYGDGGNLYPSICIIQEESPEGRPEIYTFETTLNDTAMGKENVLPNIKFFDETLVSRDVSPIDIKTENRTTETIPFNLIKDDGSKRSSDSIDRSTVSNLINDEEIIEADILGDNSIVGEANQIISHNQNISQPILNIPIVLPNYENIEATEEIGTTFTSSNKLGNMENKPIYSTLKEKSINELSVIEKNNYISYNEPNIYGIIPNYQNNNILTNRPPILKQIQNGKIYDDSGKDVPNSNAETNALYDQKTVIPCSSNLPYNIRNYLLPSNLELQSPEYNPYLSLTSDMTLKPSPNRNTLNSFLPMLKHLNKPKLDKILILRNKMPMNPLVSLIPNTHKLTRLDEVNNIGEQNIYTFTPAVKKDVNPNWHVEQNRVSPMTTPEVAEEKLCPYASNYINTVRKWNSLLPQTRFVNDNILNSNYESSLSRLDSEIIPKINKLIQTHPNPYIYQANPTLTIQETSTYRPHVYFLQDPCTYKNIFAFEGNSSAIRYLPQALTKYRDKIFNASSKLSSISNNVYNWSPPCNVYKKNLSNIKPVIPLINNIKSSVPNNLKNYMNNIIRKEEVLPLSNILSAHTNIPITTSTIDSGEFLSKFLNEPHKTMKICPEVNTISKFSCDKNIKQLEQPNKVTPANNEHYAKIGSSSSSIRPAFVLPYADSNENPLGKRSDGNINKKSLVTGLQDPNLIIPMYIKNKNEYSMPKILNENVIRNTMPSLFKSKPSIYVQPGKFMSASVTSKLKNMQNNPVKICTTPVTKDTASITYVWPKKINNYDKNSETKILNLNYSPFIAENLSSLPQLDSVSPSSIISDIPNITYNTPRSNGLIPNTFLAYTNQNSKSQPSFYTTKSKTVKKPSFKSHISTLNAFKYQPTESNIYNTFLNNATKYTNLTPQLSVNDNKYIFSTLVKNKPCPQSLPLATSSELSYRKIPLMQRGELVQEEVQTIPQDMISYKKYSSPFSVTSIQTPSNFISSNIIRYPYSNSLPIKIQTSNLQLLNKESKYDFTEPSNSVSFKTNAEYEKPIIVYSPTHYTLSTQPYSISYPFSEKEIGNITETASQNLYFPKISSNYEPRDKMNHFPGITNLFSPNTYIRSKANSYTKPLETITENKNKNLSETVLVPAAMQEYEFPIKMEKKPLTISKDDSILVSAYNPLGYLSSFSKQSNSVNTVQKNIKSIVSNFPPLTLNYSLYNYEAPLPKYSISPKPKDVKTLSLLTPSDFFNIDTTTAPIKSSINSVPYTQNLDSQQSSISIPLLVSLNISNKPQILLQSQNQQAITESQGTETLFTQGLPSTHFNADHTILPINQPGKSFPLSLDNISYNSGFISHPSLQTSLIPKTKPFYNILKINPQNQLKGKIVFKPTISYPVVTERNMPVSDTTTIPRFKSGLLSKEVLDLTSSYKYLPPPSNLRETSCRYKTKPISQILPTEKIMQFYKPKNSFINWYPSATYMEPCYSEEYLDLAANNVEPTQSNPYLKSVLPTQRNKIQNVGDHLLLMSNLVPYSSPNVICESSTGSMPSSSKESVSSMSQEILAPKTKELDFVKFMPYKINKLTKTSPKTYYSALASQIFTLPQHKSISSAESQRSSSILSYSSPFYFKNQAYGNVVSNNPTDLTRTIISDFNKNPQLPNPQKYVNNVLWPYENNQYRTILKPIKTNVLNEFYASKNEPPEKSFEIDKLIKLNTINQLNDNIKCMESTDILNRILKEKQVTVSLSNIGVANYEPTKLDNAYQIKTDNPEIDLKVWPTSIKIVKAKIVFEGDEIRALNFIPVLKKTSVYYTPEQIQRVVKEFVAKVYGEPIVVDAVYNYYEPYAIVGNIDKRSLRNDTVYIVWPTSCKCGCNRFNCNCVNTSDMYNV